MTSVSIAFQVILTCQTEGARVVDGFVSQLPHMHGDRGDGVRPDSIGHTDLKLIGAGWGVLFDDQESCSFVQDEVTMGKKQTHRHATF